MYTHNITILQLILPVNKQLIVAMLLNIIIDIIVICNFLFFWLHARNLLLYLYAEYVLSRIFLYTLGVINLK